MSRTKRLMAVPPFSAKRVSAATSGIVRTSSAAWRRYCSDAGIEALRHRNVVFRVELATAQEHALALAKVNALAVELLQPRMVMSFREPEEQAFHLDAPAVREQRLKAARTQASKPFHEDICLMKGLALRNFVEQFEDGAFRRRQGQWIFPVPPRLLREAAILWGRRRGIPFREVRRDVAVSEKL